MDISTILNSMSYATCEDSRAWNNSKERQTRFLVDAIKYEVPKHKIGIDIKEAISALPLEKCECSRQASRTESLSIGKKYQLEFRKEFAKEKHRHKDGSSRIRSKTAELTEEDVRRIFDKKSKNRLNYQKAETKRLQFDLGKPKLRPAQAHMHLPAAEGLIYKTSTERLQDTIDEIGNLINNTINAMIAVLRAYVGTAKNLYGKHQALQRKRILLQRKPTLSSSFSFDGRDHSDAISYIDFAIDDILKRLWILYEMMDASDVPETADQLFDLVEYFMEVERMYSDVIPQSKIEDSSEECSEEVGSVSTVDEASVQNVGETEELHNYETSNSSAMHATFEDFFPTKKSTEEFKHYKFITGLDEMQSREETQSSGLVLAENVKNPVGSNTRTIQTNMNNCRETLNDIMGTFRKFLCKLAAKPLSVEFPDKNPAMKKVTNQLDNKKLIAKKFKNITKLSKEIFHECENVNDLI